jgi:hypothetical protein
LGSQIRKGHIVIVEIIATSGERRVGWTSVSLRLECEYTLKYARIQEKLTILLPLMGLSPWYFFGGINLRFPTGGSA